MYLDEIISAQKRGEAKGITSICSAHAWVLKAAIKASQQTSDVSETSEVLLIESTCNQVNQFGGYTGMTPADFVRYARDIADENNFPYENIILGGDHLGPNVWQNEPAESAMQKSAVMLKDYVQAGFLKIHLDCSMRLGDDPQGALDVEVSARRAARLAKAAESSVGAGLAPAHLAPAHLAPAHLAPAHLAPAHLAPAHLAPAHLASAQLPRYVIGTEVPVPGGAREHEEGVSVTKIEDARQTIEVTREAFIREGLGSAWERVIAVVVQPGVEFGDDFVLEYQSERAKELSCFIESQPMIYEAHSTDYQTRDALKNLVREHFAILKVGPALTFAFREAVFKLAMMEDELFPKDARSNIVRALDDVMLQHPEHWKKYYRGSEEEQAFKRKYSFSDRLRYYWTHPQVQAALEKLLRNLHEKPLPLSMLSQFAPLQYERVRDKKITWTTESVIMDYILTVLSDYEAACG